MWSDTKMFWGGRNWVVRLTRRLLAWAGSVIHVSFGSIISVNGNDDTFSLQGSCVDERKWCVPENEPGSVLENVSEATETVATWCLYIVSICWLLLLQDKCLGIQETLGKCHHATYIPTLGLGIFNKKANCWCWESLSVWQHAVSIIGKINLVVCVCVAF